MPGPLDPSLAGWMDALEARHLSDLRVPEVTRALRALSSAYVERRSALHRGAALDSAGKRAAFALFYGPLHFLATRHIARALGAAGAGSSILDVGCGTGAAGAALATAFAADAPAVIGIDRHPWAVEEARWTYRHFGLKGRTQLGDLTRLPDVAGSSTVLAAYVLNELPEARRQYVEDWLLRSASRGAAVLVLEPLARRVTPWWTRAAQRVGAAGGRADEWRFQVDLPPLVRLLDRAASLDHRELTARSLSLNFSFER
ncbi:MAG TPA: class I SAM-dependent methyltransferase [Vicinamibacterales bacterium]|nr:class I SAM-dependent methyltransferase [Vicinamibacterales bacterium]